MYDSERFEISKMIGRHTHTSSSNTHSPTTAYSPQTCPRPPQTVAKWVKLELPTRASTPPSKDRPRFFGALPTGLACPSLHQDAFNAEQAAKSAVSLASRLRDTATKAGEAVKNASPGDDSIDELRDAAVKAADAAGKAEAEVTVKQLAKQAADDRAQGAAEALKAASAGRSGAEENAIAAAKHVSDCQNALAKAAIVSTTKAGAAKAASEKLQKAAAAASEKQAKAAKLADAVGAVEPQEEDPKPEAPKVAPVAVPQGLHTPKAGKK